MGGEITAEPPPSTPTSPVSAKRYIPQTSAQYQLFSRQIGAAPHSGLSASQIPRSPGSQGTGQSSMHSQIPIGLHTGSLAVQSMPEGAHWGGGSWHRLQT